MAFLAATALDQIQRSARRAAKLRRLNFLITETFQMAEEQCRQAISSGKQPFTMAIKDNYAVEGVRMTCASRTLQDFVPPYTATCVQRLLNNGGCLVGKSNMDEFAMGSTTTSGCFGPVLHSSYADGLLEKVENDGRGGDDDDAASFQSIKDFRIAGGSSGGCAVAVATGVAQMAIGSDTGGSVRYPAALNGVFGFKPSYGRLSRHGLVPLANSLDTPSIFARSLQDCQRFYGFLKGHDPMDSTTLTDAVDLKRAELKLKPINAVKDMVVGVPKFVRVDLLSPDAERVWHTAIEELASQGATIQPVELPHAEYALHCYSIVVDVEVASNMARYDGIRYGYRTEETVKSDAPASTASTFIEHVTRNRTEGLNQAVKRRIFAGNFYALGENYANYVDKAARVQRLIQRDFAEAFRSVDCILTPVSRHSAPLLSEVLQRSREEQRLDDYFVLPTNLCGLPSLSIPYSSCSQGLPLGVQLVGPYLEDERLLHMAQFLPPREEAK